MQIKLPEKFFNYGDNRGSFLGGQLERPFQRPSEKMGLVLFPKPLSVNHLRAVFSYDRISKPVTSSLKIAIIILWLLLIIGNKLLKIISLVS